MTPGGSPTIPDPEDDPKAYRRADVLEDLYVRRGWRRPDIAEHFGISTSTLDRNLRRHGIKRDVEKSHPPTSGPARKLYKMGMEAAVE